MEVLNKTGIVTSDSGVGTHVPTRNRNEIAGNPRFFGESPCNDIIVSPIRHNLARKRDVRDISPNYLCRKEQPSWKTEYVGSLRIFKCIL